MSEFGIGLTGTGAPAWWASFAARVEHLGFEVLSVFGDLGYEPPIPVLLAAAGATRRLRLGPACLNPFVTHPVEIAGQIAALDLASDGRAYLGLARGAWLERIGIVQERPLTALRDAAAIVTRLLAGDDGGYAGRAFTLEPGVRLLYPRRRRAVPLLLGGWGPRVTSLAAEIAAELKIGGTANPRVVALARERLGTTATHVVTGAVTVVDHDGGAARARARSGAAVYVDVVGSLDPTLQVDPELLGRLREALRRGDAEGAGALLDDDLLDAFALAGTPAQVAEHSARLLAAGAHRIDFGPPLGLEDRRWARSCWHATCCPRCADRRRSPDGPSVRTGTLKLDAKGPTPIPRLRSESVALRAAEVKPVVVGTAGGGAVSGKFGPWGRSRAPWGKEPGWHCTGRQG